MNASRLLTYALLLGMVAVSIVLLIDTRAQGMRHDALQQSLATQMSEIIGLNSGSPDEQPQSGNYETGAHHVIWTVERVPSTDGTWNLKWILHYQAKQQITPE